LEAFQVYGQTTNRFPVDKKFLTWDDLARERNDSSQLFGKVTSGEVA